MVSPSKTSNQGVNFNSSTSLYGNISMNPSSNNMFPYEQASLNPPRQYSINNNFSNFNSQEITNIGSFSNSQIQIFNGDPFLPADSYSTPANNLGHLFNNGFTCLSHFKLQNELKNSIQPDTSQKYQSSMVMENDVDKMLAKHGEFCSNSKNICVNEENVLYTDFKAKNKNKMNSTNGSRTRWKEEDDSILRELVKKHGAKSWNDMAKKMPGVDWKGKQLRDRYNNYLRPGLKTGAFSLEEDMKLIEAHEKMGNKWAKIAKMLPGRSENEIKNRWNATMRRCRSYNPKPDTVFEGYVKKYVSKNQKSQISVEFNTVAEPKDNGENKETLTNVLNDICSFNQNELHNDGDGNIDKHMFSDFNNLNELLDHDEDWSFLFDALHDDDE